jgi:hypothetical protein
VEFVTFTVPPEDVGIEGEPPVEDDVDGGFA